MRLQRDRYTTFEVNKSFDVYVAPALGGACLTWNLKGRVTQWGEDAAPFSGWLQFNEPGSNLIWPSFEMKSGFHQLQQFRKDYEDTLSFSGFITYGQLEAFEKERNGKDFNVVVRAELRVLNKEQEFESWHIEYESLSMPVENWLKILEQARYRQYLIQEMSFPASDRYEGNSAVFHLKRARDYFDKALYEPCLVELRKAFERITSARNDQNSIKAAEEAFSGKRKDMSFDSRIMMIRSAVQNALHKAAHANDDPAYLRSEVKALLTCTMAMIELYPAPAQDVISEDKNI